MRLGCTGCLVVLLLAGIVVGTIGATVLGLIRVLEEPDAAMPASTPAEGAAAQRKIYRLIRGGQGQEIQLSEAELNAFLSRHLAAATELPLAALGVRLSGDDRVEFIGRVPARHLLAEPPFRAVREVLPRGWLDDPVWLSLQARARLERGATDQDRRYLRLDVERFAVGRQRLPALVVRLLFSPVTLQVLRWRMPEGVESLSVEPGKVVIRTASSRRRSEAGDRR